MVFSLIAKNASQAISGSVNGTGQVTVLAASPPVAYTCPAGKKAIVRMTTLVESLAADENLRYRAAGVLIFQLGTGHDVISASQPLYIDLGIFHLDENETITCTTSNSGTEGGIIRLNAIVTSEIPRVN